MDAATALSDLTLASDSDDFDGTTTKKKKMREMCDSGCGRPSTVCICPYLPPAPIPTATTIVLLHHPHELRNNKLSTLPALLRSLLHLHPIRGRLLRPGSHPLLDSLHSHPTRPALLLFPSTSPSAPALDLARWPANHPPGRTAGPDCGRRHVAAGQGDGGGEPAFPLGVRGEGGDRWGCGQELGGGERVRVGAGAEEGAVQRVRVYSGGSGEGAEGFGAGGGQGGGGEGVDWGFEGDGGVPEEAFEADGAEAEDEEEQGEGGGKWLVICLMKLLADWHRKRGSQLPAEVLLK